MSKYLKMMKWLAANDALTPEAAEKLMAGHSTEDGGPGSGNFGHAGRPGKRGGSAKGQGGGGAGEGSGGTGSASESTSWSPVNKEISSFISKNPGAKTWTNKGGKIVGTMVKPEKPEIGSRNVFGEMNARKKLEEMGIFQNPNGEFYAVTKKGENSNVMNTPEAQKAMQVLTRIQERNNSLGSTMKETPSGYKQLPSREENLKSVQKANKDFAKEALRRAKEWPEGSPERHQYENWAKILSSPASGRPTSEESKAMTEKFASNISGQLKPYAVEKYKKDLANEPQITNDLCDIADEIGTEMYGLNYRLKKASDSDDGRCRIADKITESMEEKGLSYEEAADGLSDLVRYTQSCTTDNLVDNYEATRAALEKKGYKVVKVKNTWDSYNIDKPYRGINTVFESPTGTKFELQFHTPESIVGKEVQHGQYEEQRNPDTPEPRKKELGMLMYNNMAAMRAPKGISRIKNYP